MATDDARCPNRINSLTSWTLRSFDWLRAQQLQLIALECSLWNDNDRFDGLGGRCRLRSSWQNRPDGEQGRHEKQTCD
jgi:hypothetical protein